MYIGSDDYFCYYGVNENLWSCSSNTSEWELEIGDEFLDDETYISFADEKGVEVVSILYENNDEFFFYIGWEKDMYYIFSENQTTWY